MFKQRRPIFNMEYISQRRVKCDLTVKLFPDICDMSETICVMKGILSPTYLKTIVKCFAFMNSTTKKTKLSEESEDFFRQSGNKIIESASPCDFLISLSPTYMSHDFVNIVIVH